MLAEKSEKIVNVSPRRRAVFPGFLGLPSPKH
jgi:hypothetical protein